MLGYPFLSHNLVRPRMTPILVPDRAYDEALCDEWSNPNGVERKGGLKAEPQKELQAEPEPVKRGRGRKVKHDDRP